VPVAKVATSEDHVHGSVVAVLSAGNDADGVELVDVDTVDWSLRQSGLQMRVWTIGRTYGGACF
jgi:hypothetical protein